MQKIGIIVCSIVLIAIIASTAIISATVARQAEQMYLYPSYGEITRVDKVSNRLYILDTFGHMWKYCGAAGYHKGDHVAMMIHSNKTPNTTTDDYIIKVTFLCY